MFSKFLKRKKERFVLLTMQRTGSTYLSECLMSHPDVYMGRELFKSTSGGRNDTEAPFCSSGMSVEQYLDDFYMSKPKKGRVVGFKLMLNQLTPEILDYLLSNDIQCIYLERWNDFKLAVSRLTARKTTIYHLKKVINKPAIHLDIETLETELEKIREEKNVVKSYTKSLNTIDIKYEDFIHDKKQSVSKILQFLSVKDVGVNSELSKINSDDLNFVLSNYQDVFTYFDKTKYSHFLTPLKRYSKPYNNLNLKHKCIFIHVPKVAGSSIEKALWGTKGMIGHATAIDYKAVDHELFDIYFTFAIVRDPFDRFVSAYEYLKRGGRNKFDKAWADKHINCYPTFSDFVESLNDSAIRNNVLSWMHFKPQYKFVCDESKKVIVDFVGRYECLDKDFHYITKQLNIDVELPHENAVNREKPDLYFNKVTKETIYRIYKEDFELFNYG